MNTDNVFFFFFFFFFSGGLIGFKMANSQNMVFLDGGALMLNVRDTDDIEE